MALSDPTPNFLTPEFIRNVRFSKLRRGGYDIEEVDSFLGRFAELLESENLGSSSDQVEDTELFDPEGSAQRLLAAAQRTADSLTKEAAAQAEQLIASAEAQADNIKRVVVEEARKMAEQSQSDLNEALKELNSKQKSLEDKCGFLEGQLNAGKDQLLTVLDEMRGIIEDSDFELLAVEEDVEDLGLVQSDPDFVVDDRETYPMEEPDSEEGVISLNEIQDIGIKEQKDLQEGQVEKLEEEMPPELSLVHSTEDLESWIDAAAAGAEDGISSYWLEDDEEDGPPTQISPVISGEGNTSGDRFFEELRDSDPHESVLGLVDDETDAAISSFFSDEE